MPAGTEARSVGGENSAVQYPASVQHVVVVGAGIAGLSAARALQKQGIKFIILEAQDAVGGVWNSRYIGLKAQSPWFIMQHPELSPPLKKTYSAYQYPTGPELAAYLNLLADRFDLRRHIKFSSRVVKLERPSPGATGWRVHYETLSGGAGGAATTHVEDADFVIRASGSFTSPSIPSQYKDLEKFTGEIIPARAVTETALLKGKRVLVLGGGKSSQDMGTTAADAGAEKVINLIRRAHWVVPENLFGFLPYVWVSYSRAANFSLPTFYDQAPLPAGLETLKKAFGSFFWWFAGWASKTTLGMKGALLPEPSQNPLADQYVGGLLGNRRFYNLARSGAIKAVRGDVERFTADGVVTKTGEALGPFDVVIAATGYAKDYSYLPEAEQAALGREEDGLWLFRHILAPRVPGLAFVGAETVTFSDWLTSGVQSEWLARVLAGKVQLPSVEDQLADVEAFKQWKRSFAPPGNNRACNLMLHMTAYNDLLIRDTGLSTRRRGANILAEAFSPLAPGHYKSFFEAAALEQQGKAKPPALKPIKVNRAKKNVKNGKTVAPEEQKIELPYGGTAVKDIKIPNVLAATANRIIT